MKTTHGLTLLNLKTRIINLETLRRVSRRTAKDDIVVPHEPQNRRDSEGENISLPSRQDTIGSTWSMSTLTPAQSPESVSSIGSRSTSRSITLVESKQLRSAVNEGDSKCIKRLIGQRATEDDVSNALAPVLAPLAFDLKAL